MPKSLGGSLLLVGHNPHFSAREVSKMGGGGIRKEMMEVSQVVSSEA